MIQTPAPSDIEEFTGPAIAPFLRWAGSKRWLTARIRSIVPANFGTYFEPFLGSGAIFFSLGLPGKRCRLSDTLPALVNCFEQVRDHPELVHAAVEMWGCDRASYYEVRQLEPEDGPARAAQFIYLNRLCFNGLYRVNHSGKFNVPYGRPRFERIFSRPHELLVPSRRLRNCIISNSDFVDATTDAVAGDLIYLDPPYVAGHRNNGFVDYNARVFCWEDQRRLADECKSLTERGVMVIMSNADHPSIRELYDEEFRLEPISRFSSMSASTGARGMSEELLITNAPLERALR